MHRRRARRSSSSSRAERPQHAERCPASSWAERAARAPPGVRIGRFPASHRSRAHLRDASGPDCVEWERGLLPLRAGKGWLERNVDKERCSCYMFRSSFWHIFEFDLFFEIDFARTAARAANSQLAIAIRNVQKI